MKGVPSRHSRIISLSFTNCATMAVGVIKVPWRFRDAPQKKLRESRVRQRGFTHPTTSLFEHLLRYAVIQGAKLERGQPLALFAQNEGERARVRGNGNAPPPLPPTPSSVPASQTGQFNFPKISVKILVLLLLLLLVLVGHVTTTPFWTQGPSLPSRSAGHRYVWMISCERTARNAVENRTNVSKWTHSLFQRLSR